MSLRVKKQFPEFDINEYTDEKDLTIEGVVNEIKDFDWINESLKSSKIIEEHAEPSIHAENQQGDTLSIFLADNERFALYYSANKFFRRSSTSLLNGQEQVIEIVTLFANCERELLLNRLKASAQHHKTWWLLDFMSYFIPNSKTRNSREVTKEEFIYEVKYLRVLKNLIFSIGFFLIPTIIWVVPSHSTVRPFNWSEFLIIQGFFTLLALPAVIITINHLKRNGDWKVYFRKGENIFFIVSSDGKEMYDKGEFKNRILTVNDSNAPWSTFEFTTLIKNDGKQLHFSSLLLTSSEMDKLFGRIEESREKTRFQIIKDKKISG